MVPYTKKGSGRKEIFNEKITLFTKYVVFGVQTGSQGRSVNWRRNVVLYLEARSEVESQNQ